MRKISTLLISFLISLHSLILLAQEANTNIYKVPLAKEGEFEAVIPNNWEAKKNQDDILIFEPKEKIQNGNQPKIEIIHLKTPIEELSMLESDKDRLERYLLKKMENEYSKSQLITEKKGFQGGEFSGAIQEIGLMDDQNNIIERRYVLTFLHRNEILEIILSSQEDSFELNRALFWEFIQKMSIN